MAGSETHPASSGLDKLAPLLAEYEALRREIEWLIRDANQYQSFAFGLIAVLPPAIGILLENTPLLLLPALLMVPLPFCLLGFLFFRHHEEVFVVAAYVRDSLRPAIRALAADPEIWSWEEFKVKKTAMLERSSPLGRLSNPRVVVVLRLLLFLLPATFATLAAVAVLGYEGLGSEVEAYSWFGVALLLTALVIDVLLIAVMGVWFWMQGDLGSRVLGISAPEEP
jgi:hypothetical protein